MKRVLAMGVCALTMAAMAGAREDGLFISHVHRGGGKLERPDNTLETFLWCWGNGSALECDCRCTSDGVGIMFHDNDLKRTPRGIPADWKTRKISSMKWEEVRDIDVGSYLDPQYASQRIPTIEAVMAAMKGHPSYLLFVDEKGAGPERIAAEAKKFGVIDQVYYTGCSYPNIVKWNEAVPGGKSLLWIGKFPKFIVMLYNEFRRISVFQVFHHIEGSFAQLLHGDNEAPSHVDHPDNAAQNGDQGLNEYDLTNIITFGTGQKIHILHNTNDGDYSGIRILNGIDTCGVSLSGIHEVVKLCFPF